MSVEAVRDFVAELLVHFADTRDRDDAWADSMVKALRGFTREVLNAAAADIIATRKYRNFPLPAECIEACWKAKDRLSTAERAANLPGLAQHNIITSGKGPKQYNEMHGDQLIVGPMGRQAAKEGWILSLHDFASLYHRLPDPGEIPRLKQAAKSFDTHYAICVRGGWEQAQALVQGIGDTMLAKRKKYAAMAQS